MWSHQVTGLWVIFVSFSPHITIGSWGNSLPVCAKWSELLLFSSVSRCIALWLFPQQSGAIQFWVLTSVPQDKLWELPPACFGKLDCRPTLTLTFVAFPHSFSESSALRVLFLAPLHSLGQVQRSTPTSALGVRLQSTVYAFQFCWGWGSVYPWAVRGYVPGGE
jgi:hypothetical protein